MNHSADPGRNAIQRLPAGTPVQAVKDNIIARRGSQARNITKVAAAPICSPACTTLCATATSGH